MTNKEYKKKYMDKKDLEKLIAEKTKKAERERKKREYIVIAIYTIIFFSLYCFLEKTPDKLGDAVSVFIVAFVFASLHCGINHAVFEHLFAKDEAARNEIEELKRQK